MLIHVTVKTGRREDKIISSPDGNYIIYLRAKPHDNAANLALINLLARYFHVPKTSITIVRGLTAHVKTISLPD